MPNIWRTLTQIKYFLCFFSVISNRRFADFISSVFVSVRPSILGRWIWFTTSKNVVLFFLNLQLLNDHKIQNIIRKRFQSHSVFVKTCHRRRIKREMGKNKNWFRAPTVCLSRSFFTQQKYLFQFEFDSNQKENRRCTLTMLMMMMMMVRTYVAARFLWNFIRFFLSFFCSLFLLIITYLHGAQVCACVRVYAHNERTTLLLERHFRLFFLFSFLMKYYSFGDIRYRRTTSISSSICSSSAQRRQLL